MGSSNVLAFGEADHFATLAVPGANSEKGVGATTELNKGAIPFRFSGNRGIRWSSNLVLLAPPIFTWQISHFIVQGFSPATLVRDLTPAAP